MANFITKGSLKIILQRIKNWITGHCATYSDIAGYNFVNSCGIVVPDEETFFLPNTYAADDYQANDTQILATQDDILFNSTRYLFKKVTNAYNITTNERFVLYELNNNTDNIFTVKLPSIISNGRRFIFYAPNDANEDVIIEIYNTSGSGKLKELKTSNLSNNITLQLGECIEMWWNGSN